MVHFSLATHSNFLKNDNNGFLDDVFFELMIATNAAVRKINVDVLMVETTMTNEKIYLDVKD